MNITRLAPLLMLMSSAALGQTYDSEDRQSRTVLGPSNVDLADGATALRMGDAEKGVTLTQRGLRSASSKRERVAGYSNLCAGFIMLEQFEQALESCNSALALDDRHWRTYSNRALAYLRLKRYAEAEQDIRRGEELNPNARTLKVVKSLYLDAVDPVTPSITIDYRRRATDGDN